jgi:hypothetical protein
MILIIVANAFNSSAVATMISSSFNDPNQAIITHHAVQCEIIGTADRILPLRQELDGVEEEMLIGLMLNKGFLDSNYGAYANMSVALDVLISRYISFRQRIERWQRDSVWAPLCRIHDIYKPTPAELSHRIRIKNPEKKPWTPSIQWTRQELRDNTQKVNLLLQLREKLGKPGYPRTKIYQAINENPKEIKKLLEIESKEDSLAKSNVNLNGGASSGAGGSLGGGGGGGLPSLDIDTSGLGGGGSSGSSGGGGEDVSKMSDSDLPEFNGAGNSDKINKPAIPPESAKIQNEKSPTS